MKSFFVEYFSKKLLNYKTTDKTAIAKSKMNSKFQEEKITFYKFAKKTQIHHIDIM